MLFELLLTLLLTSHVLLPATTNQTGQVLGTQTQEGGNRVEANGPVRIINKNLGVKISATNAVVIDKESGQILWAKNAEEARPIASITKLMTALVFLATNPDLKQEIEIIENDLSNNGKVNFSLGEKITLENLLHLSLIASDNNAALTLVRATGLSQNEFVEKMNIQAKALGLKKMHFIDPVGLSKENVATPYEVAMLMKVASEHTLIRKILALQSYNFQTSLGYHQIKSTNKLLGTYLNVLAGKTGFTEEARDCFVGLIKLPPPAEKNGHEIIAVVLNAANSDARFQDIKALASWVEENYLWN